MTPFSGRSGKFRQSKELIFKESFWKKLFIFFTPWKKNRTPENVTFAFFFFVFCFFFCFFCFLFFVFCFLFFVIDLIVSPKKTHAHCFVKKTIYSSSCGGVRILAVGLTAHTLFGYLWGIQNVGSLKLPLTLVSMPQVGLGEKRNFCRGLNTDVTNNRHLHCRTKRMVLSHYIHHNCKNYWRNLLVESPQVGKET